MKCIVSFFAVLSFAVAYASTSVVLPSPIALGMETSAVLPLPEMASNKTQRLTVSVEAFNVATNQFEIWFCNDMVASREARDYLIGFDEGRLIEGRHAVESVEMQESVLPIQNVRFDTTVRSRTDPFRTKAELIINGVVYPINFQSTFLLRSLRVVLRGLDHPQPRLSEGLVSIGLSLRVR